MLAKIKPVSEMVQGSTPIVMGKVYVGFSVAPKEVTEGWRLASVEGNRKRLSNATTVSKLEPTICQ